MRTTRTRTTITTMMMMMRNLTSRCPSSCRSNQRNHAVGRIPPCLIIDVVVVSVVMTSLMLFCAVDYSSTPGATTFRTTTTTIGWLLPGALAMDNGKQQQQQQQLVVWKRERPGGSRQSPKEEEHLRHLHPSSPLTRFFRRRRGGSTLVKINTNRKNHNDPESANKLHRIVININNNETANVDIVHHHSLSRTTATATTTGSKKSNSNPTTTVSGMSLFICSTLSCFSTWMCINHGGLTPVRASSLHGLMASLVLRLPPHLSAACLSGSFTGMSSYLTTTASPVTTTMPVNGKYNQHNYFHLLRPWMNAGLLSFLSGFVYAWEGTHPSWQWILAGKGGRLGTISVMATLLYFLLHGDARCWTLIWNDWIVQRLGIITAVGLALTWGIAWGAHENQQRLEVATKQQQQQQDFGMTNIQQRQFFAQSSVPQPQPPKRPHLARIWRHRDGRKNKSKHNKDMSIFQQQQHEEYIQLLQMQQQWLTIMAKGVMITTLLRHYFYEYEPGLELAHVLESTLMTFCSSLFLYQHKGSIVVPMSLIGLLASMITSPPHQTAMCVGGLIGMTRLPKFTIWSHFEASIWVTLLLYDKGLSTVGGRLGVMTVLSVVLAYLPWWWQCRTTTTTTTPFPTHQEEEPQESMVQ